MQTVRRRAREQKPWSQKAFASSPVKVWARRHAFSRLIIRTPSTPRITPIGALSKCLPSLLGLRRLPSPRRAGKAPFPAPSPMGGTGLEPVTPSLSRRLVYPRLGDRRGRMRRERDERRRKFALISPVSTRNTDIVLTRV